MKHLIKTLAISLLLLGSSIASSAERVITFSASPVTTSSTPFTCETSQADGYAYTVSMYGTATGCVPAVVYNKALSLYSGKVGTSSSIGIVAPTGVYFTIKSFSLVGATLKYPIMILAFDGSGNNTAAYTLLANRTGVYTVPAGSLDNANALFITARSQAGLYLSNVDIVE